MLKEPITITLYDGNNEPIKECQCSVIPWKMFKRAMSFQNYVSKDTGDIDDNIFDAMGQYVCDVFKNQFTLDELNEGADGTEVLSVIKAVASRASFE